MAAVFAVMFVIDCAIGEAADTRAIPVVILMKNMNHNDQNIGVLTASLAVMF